LRYLILLILATLLATPAIAADLLIIQSHRNQQFDQTARKIQTSCGKKNQTYVMGDYAEFDLGRIVREEKPRLVVALGDRPLKEARKLRSTPVVYAMALSAGENLLGNNMTGVSMYAAPENYLKLFRTLGLQRVGVVYSKGKSGAYLAKAEKIAAAYGVKLMPAQIKAPQEVDAALASLTDRKIDSLWMIPDTTAVTAENLGSYFTTAQKANLPLISFSRAYLEKGAMAVLEASRTSMTEHLCSDITRLLSGTEPADIPPDDIAEATLYSNDFIARRLNFSFSGTDTLFRSGKE
jgi:putative tryptophan/tyrosine transport system substrate-binding protein